MIPVWTFPYDYPTPGIERETEQIVTEFAPGFYRTRNADVATSRADGTGGTSSIKGADTFRIRINRSFYNAAQDFRQILSFLQARKDNLIEPFYFYSIIENHVEATWSGDTASGPIADGNGNMVDNTTGRYKVIHLGDVDWNLVRRKEVPWGLTFRQILN